MQKEIERFTFRIPNELLNVLKHEAEKKGVSNNAIILQILWSWVKENGKEWKYEKPKETDL
ncbi:Arc family DNA-binding protein [Dielma fastidiosa]|uniref:Arc-like DNA binding dprotein n=1 Tax=Dielma fastidiosa TaxID=1034346 RepID=A0A318KNL3_9FIRM|nr:Arc family DNA-binding protein [Dielma fastidiosa]PXX77385.1 Arc-like DNA binding dprotein [Dielma fastidiosa]